MNTLRLCFMTLSFAFLTTLMACSQTQEETGPPPCDTRDLDKLTAQVKEFIWGKDVPSFNNGDWYISALTNLLQKYQSVKQGNLFTLLKLRSDVNELEQSLQNLLKLSKQHKTQVETFACLANDNDWSKAREDVEGITTLLGKLKDLQRLLIK
ncbi:hypothetical protein [Thalassotalea maritima]|uniref:hypothetical protein n=1 Tax=Thalassotalea maritima TaxID=3242416 RepID=UPI0035299662